MTMNFTPALQLSDHVRERIRPSLPCCDPESYLILRPAGFNLTEISPIANPEGATHNRANGRKSGDKSLLVPSLPSNQFCQALELECYRRQQVVECDNSTEIAAFVDDRCPTHTPLMQCADRLGQSA